MNYQVIARKWRPATFSDVVGQQHVLRTLSNALRGGSVAHAYIFSGARGVGKTTTARILAKALNCVHGPTPEPCNECDSCREIAAGNSLDVIEIDAASNRGIDQIRELREMVRYAPAGGRHKVVILDEAHMLTTEASNALLKTLEEPPDKVVFVMATTQPEDLSETIRSRSQHFHFRALSFSEIDGALAAIAKKEQLDAQPGALAVIARAADGSLRDALSLLEQARAYCGNTITETQVRELLGVVPSEVLDELVAAIDGHSAERVLALVHRLLAEGQNLQQFCHEAIGHFRNLLIARVCGADTELVAAPAEERPRLARAAALFSEEDLTRFFEILLGTDEDLRRKPDPRLHLEMGLLRLVNAARLAPMEEILAELSGAAAPRHEPSHQAAPAPAPAPASANSGKQNATPAVAAAAAAAATSAAPPAPAAQRGYERGHEQSHERGHAVAASEPHASNVSSAAVSEPQNVPAAAAEALRGIDAGAVASIKEIVLSQQKFLGELVGNASQWELEGGELRLYFPAGKRALAELLQAREPMEKLRTIVHQVLGRSLRVCVKLDSKPDLGATISAGESPRELRARFERDPIVRAMLDRFGGKVSEVKRRGEG